MTRLLVTLMISLVTSAVASAVPYASADASSSQAYQVKAAFLYNFAKFTEWPADAFSDAQASLCLCVLGTDPFGDALKPFKKTTVRKRKLVIKYLESLEQLDICHILFISSSEKNQLLRIFATLETLPILTVGDMDRFAQAGGVIRLLIQNNKIRFAINIGAAKRAGLTISSKVLHLAEEIIEDPH